MLQKDITNVYPRLEVSRRHSIDSSAPSSKYTENDIRDAFRCPRVNCHCDAANIEEPDPNESIILSRALSSSQRRHADYFYRPPIPNSHREQHMSDESPYSYFQYKNNPDSESEYCEQCQFCSVSSKWCGRLPSARIIKRPKSFLGPPSEQDLYGLPEPKVYLPNATWVQEPLIANPAQIVDEDEVQEQQFPPAVFSHTLTGQSFSDLPPLPHQNAVFATEDANSSVDSLQRYRTLTQGIAHGYRFLKSFRDVRCTREESWAIEDGSLVISIPGTFVDLKQQCLVPDEFELRPGEVFVICRMFSDMWALCARLRMSESVATLDDIDPQISHNIKFLPLCAVTLAANYAAFDRRCAAYKQQNPFSNVFPSGGRRIQPPERTVSLIASRELSQGIDTEILPLPKIVYDICKAPVKLPPSRDYVPLAPLIDLRDKYLQNEPDAKVNGSSFKIQGTLSRFWKKFNHRESGSSTVRRGTTDSSQLNSSCTPSTQAFDPNPPRQDAIEGKISPGNMIKVKKRKSVRNVFSWNNASGTRGEDSF